MGGDFIVDGVCFAGFAPQVPRQLPGSSSDDDKYVAMVSGLGLGRPESDMLKVGIEGRGCPSLQGPAISK